MFMKKKNQIKVKMIIITKLKIKGIFRLKEANVQIWKFILYRQIRVKSKQVVEIYSFIVSFLFHLGNKYLHFILNV